MKFQDAFNAAFDERAKVDKERGREFVMQASTLKILAFAWNMLAVAQNKLDDTVIIGDNNEIISTPFAEEEKLARGRPRKEESENTSSAEKTSDKVEDNGEKEPKETTEPEPEKPTEE